MPVAGGSDSEDPSVMADTSADLPRGFGRRPRAEDLRQIGRYPVMGLLGEGGMGAVYAAYDEQLDRRIAIKLLLPRDSAGKAHDQARIHREAQAMARLSHPSIAHVYEVGQFEERTYISMEYVRGVTLRTWQATERALDERLDVLLQAGRGLAAAHRAGIVHRDFKPDNIMIDRRGRVRVLDFGLAKAHDDAVERTAEVLPVRPPDGVYVSATELTREGTVMGTPAYMSPEQHLGKPTNSAADQYGFCAVAYELLYGVRPFTGINRLAIFHAIHLRLFNRPPADHGVPPAVLSVLTRGLSREPQARWPSMEALIEALEVAVGGRRRPWLRPLLAGVGLMLIGVLASLLWVSEPPVVGPPTRIEAIAQSAIEAGAHARWVYPAPDEPTQTALIRVFELDAVATDVGTTPESTRWAERWAAQLRDDFGSALTRLGDTYWDQPGGRVFARDFYLQAALFDGGQQRARERSGMTNGELADLRVRALAGELTEAELVAGAELAMIAAATVHHREHEGLSFDDILAQARLRRMGGLSPLAPPEPSVVPREVEAEVEPRAEPEVVQSPRDDSSVRAPTVRRARALVAEGRRLRAAGRIDAAEARFEAALRLNERSAGAHDGLRRLRFDEGHYDEALRHALRAVRHGSRNARYRLALGNAYYKVGRLDDARRAYAKAATLGSPKARTRLAMLGSTER